MSAKPEYAYPGGELALFAQATNWKRYWSNKLSPFLCGDVLEVGAGTGINTRLLRNAAQKRWVCLEPDRQLLARLRDLPLACEIVAGTVADLSNAERFDAVLYVDVLEHIENDAGELACAATLLKPGGHLIVLSPAHQWLFSEFDAAIGHCRRYNKAGLLRAAPDGMRVVRVAYLDAAGMMLSLGNRLLLRQSLPTAGQISFWDRFVVPVSRVLDPLLGHTAGKSVLAIWIKTG